MCWPLEEEASKVKDAGLKPSTLVIVRLVSWTSDGETASPSFQVALVPLEDGHCLC